MKEAIGDGGQPLRPHVDGQRIQLLDLPPETVKNIFEEVPYSDLPVLMRVSRDFRELAAAELYRDVCHTFPDENDIEPVDYLAGLLETLATSEYNYASHIRQISVDSVNIGDAGERTYREYLYTTSCGKLLNFSLLMVLRRTVALETFSWNVRIELSPAVLTKLSELPSLRHFNVRLQAGHSLHSKSWTSPSVNHNTTSPPVPPPPGAPASWNHGIPDQRTMARLTVEKAIKNPASFSKFKNLESFGSLEIDSLEYLPELSKCIQASAKSLKRLALSFSESLSKRAREAQPAPSDTEFTLSDGEMSDNGAPLSPHGTLDGTSETWQMAHEAQEAALARMLGQQTSEKQVDQMEKIISKAERDVYDGIKSSYRENDDREFVEALRENLKLARGNVDVKASKHLKVIDRIERAATKYLERNEFSEADLKKKKEKAIPRISPKKIPKPPAPYQYPSYSQPYAPPILQPNGSSPPYLPSSQAEEGAWMSPPGQLPLSPSGPSQANHYAMPGPSHGKVIHSSSSAWLPASSKSIPYESDLLSPPLQPAPSVFTKAKKSFTSKSSYSSSHSESSHSKPASENDYFAKSIMPAPKRKERDSRDSPPPPVQAYDDDVDLDHPDDIGEEVEDQEFLSSREQEHNPVANDVHPRQAEQPNGLKGGGTDSLDTPKDKGKGKEIVRDPPIRTSSNVLDASLSFQTDHDFEGGSSSKPKSKPSPLSTMEEYLRLSHGLALEAVAIHRIPVKPSVLFTAVDVSRLKSLTLLDVGPQRTTWAMLSKLNKSNPLALQCIHTNNVTHSLLVLLSGLQPGILEELFLFEPSSRHRPRTLPKTVVTLEELRKQALRKHISHLKILSIRNDDDNSWAFDREAVRLLSKAGKLRELVAAMFSEGLHLLLRHLPKLAQLHALHIIYLPSSAKHSTTVPPPPNPNNVNIVINGAPPGLPPPHHPNHHLPAPARISLQARDAVLSELRASIVDALALCKQTELEWIGLTYSSAGSGSYLRLARLFNWRREKKKADSERSTLDHGDSSDSEEENTVDDIIGIEDYLGLADAADGGIAIWDKGVWAAKL